MRTHRITLDFVNQEDLDREDEAELLKNICSLLEKQLLFRFDSVIGTSNTMGHHFCHIQKNKEVE